MATEVPVRERLRWEKELLGLYLSEHPMGEVAEQVGRFVNAYSGDLRDESLDGQRIVVGGIVTGIRSVVTKRQEAMAIATIEDLQGTIEVVVFPRLYETTRGTWRDGSILLVAGRIDHRGEEVSLLADLAVDWDDAVARGPEAFGREVAAGGRGRSGGYGRNGNGHGQANGSGGAPAGPGSSRPMVPVGPGCRGYGRQRSRRIGGRRAIRVAAPDGRRRDGCPASADRPGRTCADLRRTARGSRRGPRGHRGTGPA